MQFFFFGGGGGDNTCVFAGRMSHSLQWNHICAKGGGYGFVFGVVIEVGVVMEMCGDRCGHGYGNGVGVVVEMVWVMEMVCYGLVGCDP